MSVFVDTGVFYAHHDADAALHDAACEGMDRLLDGDYGQPYTSDYVYDEAVTLTRRRTGDVEAATTIGDRIRGADPFPRVFDLLFVSAGDFEASVAAFERYDDHGLSFTDAATVALCETHDVDAVMSFDDDFDGVVERIDPRTA